MTGDRYCFELFATVPGSGEFHRVLLTDWQIAGIVELIRQQQDGNPIRLEERSLTIINDETGEFLAVRMTEDPTP